jgi:hypothetical protein
MSKKYIVYIGREFTIEWYYDERGQSAAMEYFDNLLAERKLFKENKIGKIL